ncbi:MAG: glycosyltransferase family 4 protein [Vulcanimicrobiaceae bacterium]
MELRTPPSVRPSQPNTVFLGSFPPRECGIATFTKDVVDSYDLAFGTTSDVVAIDEPGGSDRVYPERVIARLGQEDRASYRDVARLINAHPAKLLDVQHEYGLFGGPDGAWFLDLMQELEKPVVVSLHTVLPKATDSHRAVARRLCERADAVVVLSQTGKDILVDQYGVDPHKLHVIHHGVPDVPFQSTDTAKAAFGVSDRMIISTFGLISRGKGLEYGIQAMRSVVQRHPEALYLILGQTHPGVRRFEGESYRAELNAMVVEYGLQNNVKLVDRFLEFDELIGYLSATDIYLTPYLNPVQIVSGTLAYAAGAGKAIVSTPYLYAEELLAHGRGMLVPFRDAPALATAITELLSDPFLRRATERRAYRFGRQMTWPHVAAAYARVFEEVLPGGQFGGTSQLVRPA